MFSNDGRTITVTAAPQVTAQAPPQPTAAPPSVTGSSSTTTTVPISRRYFAVVDASHGGDERGAAISDQLAEKDVTLAFARRLRQELEARGLTTLLLRDGDTSLTLDQRANIANSNHPAIYICVHASSQGYGIRLYNAMVRSVADSHGPFLDWSSAQAPFFTLSQTLRVLTNDWCVFETGGSEDVLLTVTHGPVRGRMQRQVSQATVLHHVLALFGWTIAILTWILVRLFSGGMLSVFEPGFLTILVWSGISTVFAWLTAAVAAVMVGSRLRGVRRSL